MANQIGIPRAMSYHNFYPFWYGFFNFLGIDIVLSDFTTKQTMSRGAAYVVSETCLPIKIYVGHVLNLLDKGVDKIFVPSLQSIAHKIYNCSKIRGLPDLIRNVLKKEFTMIEPTLDKSEKDHGLYNFLMEAVAPFNITDKDLIKKASKEGWKVMNNFLVMTRSGLSHKEALKNALDDKMVITKNHKSYPIKIAVVGHAYNIFDERVSMKIFDKLEALDVQPVTTENLTFEQTTEGIMSLGSNIYWANEHEMTGAAGHYIQDNSVDGVISITAFGCGPDSLMIEKIARFAKQYKKPHLNLTVDEQTGEAGFVTRIEAFVDMLYRKKRANIMKNVDIDDEENFKVNLQNIETQNDEVFKGV